MSEYQRCASEWKHEEELEIMKETDTDYFLLPSTIVHINFITLAPL